MQTGAPFWNSLVFDGIDKVEVEPVTVAFGTVEVVARGRAAGVVCPDCGRFADRIRDRYQCAEPGKGVRGARPVQRGGVDVGLSGADSPGGTRARRPAWAWA
ncbi:hypothetical protein [Streptomyces sp. NPDC086010]|uniref:hypothetical protein n=1 Tax=Streptomyces sp. NPDC086010 TaxID=3365745 RepID=UPI0037D16128